MQGQCYLGLSEVTFIVGCPHVLYEGLHCTITIYCGAFLATIGERSFVLNTEGPYLGHLGLSEVAFIEGCPHIRGGLYEGLHTHLFGEPL